MKRGIPIDFARVVRTHSDSGIETAEVDREEIQETPEQVSQGQSHGSLVKHEQGLDLEDFRASDRSV
jgi:hypothetical protein